MFLYVRHDMTLAVLYKTIQNHGNAAIDHMYYIRAKVIPILT